MADAAPLVSIFGVCFSYGKNSVLREVSFELDRGKITALLGPNGSGKSTLLKIISGILPLQSPDSGQIRFSGTDFLSLSAPARARQIAYVPADLLAEFPLTAFEAVMMGQICHHPNLFNSSSQAERDQAHWAMEECLCWHLRERDLHSLSGGERQLVTLARALVQGAKVFLLDETLSKMDLNHQAAAGKLLRKWVSRGYSIVLVSHDLNLATEWADECVLLKQGEKIAWGPTREIITTERIRALYPGPELIVAPHPSTGMPKVFFGKMGS